MVVRLFHLSVLVIAVGFAPARAAEPASVRLDQPVQEYFTPLGADVTPLDQDTYGTRFTHLGSDFGAMGPHAGRVGWAPGGAARVDLRDADGWAGLWHSLAGPAAERDRTLDFARCYPPVV